MSTISKLVSSWRETQDCIHTTDELLNWITHLNQTTLVCINKINLEDDPFWFLDAQTGEIRNKNNSFFSIKGCALIENGKKLAEQPIIIQDEIGYLGIICKEINGTIHLLMQAKIEPGNINKIQLSPTIQATKSNFTQQHGGAVPAYLDFFLHAEQHEIITDQIQSEQSSRFYKKRNRNIIIKIDSDIELFPNFKWITLGQLKQLMEIDNIVNMDTRTVLSCIPFSVEKLNDSELSQIEESFSNKELFRSIFIGDGINHLPQIYRKINNYKMFTDTKSHLLPLTELENWTMQGKEFICKSQHPFKLIFCDIEIEGREVKKWSQPLFEAIGMASFGLFVSEIDDMWKFLVKITPEIGAMDILELGPSVSLEAGESFDHDKITKLFKQKWDNKQNILHNVILSEEGGRFYHEQNHNVIIKIDSNEIKDLPTEYLWVDFYTLNHLVQINNCLNIQLRNLLSLLKVSYENI